MTARHRPFPNILIRASAGTGKTFQLSNRYIALAAAGEPTDTILASTFTRKAAGEILDRILNRLAEGALNPAKAAELGGFTQSKLDLVRCLELLRQMVSQLHRIRSGTLDSFFMQIARSFALELGLPLGWQIVDDVADAALQAEAIRGVMADQSTDDVVKLMHLLTKGEASRSVSEQIGQLVRGLYALYCEAPQAAWHSLPRPRTLPEPQLAMAVATVAALPMPDGRFTSARDNDLANVQAEDWEAFLSKGLAGKVFVGEGTYYRKPIDAAMVQAYQPLLDHARAVLLGRIANQTEATWRLLDHFDRAYQRLKSERRAMRFEDITRRLGAGAVLERLEAVVYRLDAHLSHLLLDEFQDTSPLQWHVLRPFARHVAGDTPQRSLFCVGDVKQAIYGWRGGVAEIFEAIRDELPGLVEQSLNESFRSAPAVIETVNRIFENLKSNSALQNHPAAVSRWSERFQRHSTARMKLPGYCRMMAAPRAAEGTPPATATLIWAAEEVQRLHAEAPAASIGVLVRRNVAVARMIYELRSRGIEASEEGGNPLTDSAAVQLVLSLLAVADHPGDTAARFHVAHSPLGERLGLSDPGDDAAAARLAEAIRRRLAEEGYGPTLYDWSQQLADVCDRRDLKRLAQLVELAYGYESSASNRPDDFIRLVENKRVEDPTSAQVRVMTVHQSKGLQFDVVVLPELDARLAGQPPEVVLGRSRPTAPVERICRYVSKDLRGLLPAAFQRMFDDYERQVVEESLCVLYVALTRAVHALHMIVAPSRENEKTIPGTFAGVLRQALTDGSPLQPEVLAFEHGDREWFRALPAAKTAPAARAEGAKTIRLAQVKERTRGLEWRSPSQLEGGGAAPLASLLRLDWGARERGTLIHAWLALIEWLEEGEPAEQALDEVASAPAFARLDTGELRGVFRAALQKPAIRAALSRKTYEQIAAGQARSAVHADSHLGQPRWEVWRERPFAVRDGEGILSGTIDRLVVLFDGQRPVGADVLDFKSDRLAAGDARALQARTEFYRAQLGAYVRAVAGLFGLDPAHISARLAFLEPGIVCRL